MTLTRHVLGCGPAHTDIVLVGEAPSVEEVSQGKPFVGPSGRVLRQLLPGAGLDVTKLRIENVIERKLDNNSIAPLYDSSNLPGEELRAWYADLANRLRNIAPRVVVTLGDTALRAVLDRHDLKISQVQGYVYLHQDGYWVVPAYHPAFIFRQPDYTHWLTWALRKAKALATGEAKPDPPMLLNVVQNLAQLPDLSSATCLSIDIETYRDTQELRCIGIAPTPGIAYVIPLVKEFGERFWDEADELAIWLWLAKLLSNETPKVLQNAIFDTLVLRKFGLEVNGTIYDTLVQANYLNPELPKSLEDLGRLYCYCEPWKQLSENDKDIVTLWRYNAFDVTKTMQIFLRQLDELAARKLLKPYQQYVQPLTNIVKDMCIRGMPVDLAALEAAQQAVDALLTPISLRLSEIANPLIPPQIIKKQMRDKPNDTKDAKTGVVKKAWKIVETPKPRLFSPNSPDQIKLILELLGYKIPTKQGKATSDRTALLKLQRKQPSEFIELLLKYSKLNKLRTSYLNAKFDGARNIYSCNVAGTKSGRFSCASTPWDTGLNPQTIPRTEEPNLRNIFVADEGKTLVQVDLSQAELRIVAWLSGDATLCELLERKEDIHAYTAKAVQHLTGIDCPRQLGKRINHASNYGMGPNKFVDSCLLESDIVITPAVASQLLEARKRAFPGVTRWQHQIENEVRRLRRLTSPTGRERYFYGRVTDDTIREALSFIPQATVVDYLNSVWIKLANYEVLMQGHDSLLFQLNNATLAEDVATIKQAFASERIIINGISRAIPCDVKLGQRWGSLVDEDKWSTHAA